MSGRVIVALFSISVLGCVMPDITPRQNFDMRLRNLVGADLSKHEVVQGNLADKRRIIESKPLANGNIENYYAQEFRDRENPQMQCVYAVEYNPKTKIVVAARIHGGAEACFTPL